MNQKFKKAVFTGITLALSLLGMMALAQSGAEEAAPEAASRGTGLLELFNLGGPFMWPLLFFSIIVVGVILERLIVFASYRFTIKKFAQDLIKQIRRRDLSAAINLCTANKKNVGAPVFEKALPALKKSQADFEKTLEAAANVRVSALEKNLNVLSTMGNLAPLTGFLGTVSGMITAFKTIALSDNVTAKLVAGGIYEALITTAAGLIVAIVAVGFNNFLVHKVDSAVKQIEEAANEIADAYSEAQLL